MGLLDTIGWGLITAGGRLLGIGGWCQLQIWLQFKLTENFCFYSRLLRIGGLGRCARCVVFLYLALGIFFARMKLLWKTPLLLRQGLQCLEMSCFTFLAPLPLEKINADLAKSALSFFCEKGYSLPHSTSSYWLKSKLLGRKPEYPRPHLHSEDVDNNPFPFSLLPYHLHHHQTLPPGARTQQVPVSGKLLGIGEWCQLREWGWGETKMKEGILREAFVEDYSLIIWEFKNQYMVCRLSRGRG